MCFFLSTANKKPKGAKKDLICYKTFYTQYDPGSSPRYLSPYREFEYELNKVYRIFMWLKFPKEKKNLKNELINRGFHSYITLKTCYEDGYDVFKCIIPKGSKYFKNRTEYVSNRIKILEKYK